MKIIVLLLFSLWKFCLAKHQRQNAEAKMESDLLKLSWKYECFYMQYQKHTKKKMLWWHSRACEVSSGFPFYFQ